MQYSPKLKRVAEQIKKILKDNDVAGFCTLHTSTGNGEGFSEFILEITPSYSCIEWFPQKDGVKIKGKLVHYNGNKDLRDKKLNATINMLHHLSTVTGQNSLNLMQISDQADKTWEAEHGGGGFTSEQQQNN